MNLILFDSGEPTALLARNDPRAVHLLGVLQRKAGDSFDAGVINGPRGKGTLTGISPLEVSIAFDWGEPPPPLDPIIVVVGLPRPQTARHVLRDATALGVGALHFVATEKSDPSYAQSTLWSSGEWRRHVLDGAQQAFDTRLPEITHGRPLAEILAQLPIGYVGVALDNYEASGPLGQCVLSPGQTVVLAIGPERGWGPADRAAWRTHAFQLVHLGQRVLRTETAVTTALALVRSKMGLI